jgi:hypothetical protein
METDIAIAILAYDTNSTFDLDMLRGFYLLVIELINLSGPN